MGILDFFSKKKQQDSPPVKTAPPESVEELRKQLFEAIDKNQMVEFEHLCTDNEDVIMRTFPKWNKPADEIKNDKDAFKKYAYCLMIIASYFQRNRNRGELMTQLTGIDDSELSRNWQQDLGQAQQHMQQLQLEEAIPLLQRCLERANGVSGASVEKFLPLTLGFMGECHFHLAQMEKASEFMERAYQLCNMSGDFEASMAYRSNLYEIYRYMGDQKKALECAQEISKKNYDRGELVQASNWREQAKAVAAGEPLHRVVVRIAEEIFELNDLPKVEGEQVEFVLTRNRIELVRCTQKCFQGRDQAQKGNFTEAVETLRIAEQYDPHSPQPCFLAASINLAGRNYAEAVADFEKVEKLCPGFETSRSDSWLARQLLAGTMEHDACMVAFEVNNSETPAENRIGICEVLIAKYPQFTEAYYKMGKLLVESGKVEEGVAAWMKGLETTTEENDVRTRIYRDLAMVAGDPEEKKAYLEKVIAFYPDGNYLANAMAHFMLRQMAAE